MGFYLEVYKQMINVQMYSKCTEYHATQYLLHGLIFGQNI